MSITIQEYSSIVRERAFYSSDPKTQTFPLVKCCRGDECCYSVTYPDVLCGRCKLILVTKGRVNIRKYHIYPEYF